MQKITFPHDCQVQTYILFNLTNSYLHPKIELRQIKTHPAVLHSITEDR